MTHISRFTGLPISLEAHIEQSIMDIITTRIGSRVMRRLYGALAPDLVDRPATDHTFMMLMSSAVMAILSDEPRVTLSRLYFTPSDVMSGRVEMRIDAMIKETKQPLNIFKYLTPKLTEVV